MLLRTHVVIAILVFLSAMSLIPEKLLFLSFFLLATIFVDIDTKKSKAGQSLLLRPLQWLTKHRGIFHTIFFALLLSFLIYYFNRIAGIAFFSGYILHLLIDCCTKNGVRIFWPISDFKLGLGLKSGGLIEEILFVLVLLFNLFILIRFVFN